MKQRLQFPAALSAIAFALAAGSAQAQVVNGGFAGLGGWSTAGDAAAVSTGGNHLVVTDAYADGSDDTDGRNRNRSGNEPLATGGGAGTLEAFVGVAGGAFDPDPATLQAYEGSAVQQSFSVAANSSLTFLWNFGTTQASGNAALADVAFVVLDGRVVRLADTLDASTALGDAEYAARTGWAGWSTALSAGSHTIAFGVVDVGSFGDSSALSVSNVTLGVSAVPEAPMLAMVGAGLGLLVLMQRRRRGR